MFSVGAGSRSAGRVFISGVSVLSIQMLVTLPLAWQMFLVSCGSMLLLMAILIARQGVRVDAVEALLAVRIGWLSVLMFVNGGSEWQSYLTGSFLSAIIALLSYSAARRCTSASRVGRSLRLVFIACLLVLCTQSLAAFLQHADISSYAVRKYYVDIPFGNSNSIAMMVSTLGIYLAGSAARVSERAAWAALVVIFAVVLSSFGNFLVLLAFVVGLGIAHLGRVRINSRLIAIVLMGTAVLMTIGGLYAGQVEDFAGRAFSDVQERATAVQVGDIDAATTNRTLVYLHYVAQIAESPLVGYGTQPLPVAGPTSFEGMRPHNLVLEALFQGGLINLILYLGAVYWAFRRLRRHTGNRPVKTAALFLFVFSMIEPGLFALNKDLVFWTILGSGTMTEVDCEGRGGSPELQQCT